MMKISKTRLCRRTEVAEGIFTSGSLASRSDYAQCTIGRQRPGHHPPRTEGRENSNLDVGILSFCRGVVKDILLTINNHVSSIETRSLATKKNNYWQNERNFFFFCSAIGRVVIIFHERRIDTCRVGVVVARLTCISHVRVVFNEKVTRSIRVRGIILQCVFFLNLITPFYHTYIIHSQFEVLLLDFHVGADRYDLYKKPQLKIWQVLCHYEFYIQLIIPEIFSCFTQS